MKRNRGDTTGRNIRFKKICLEKNELWIDCFYCESTIFYIDMVLDHVEPWSFGGTNEEKNLVPVCKNCNQSKASKLLIGWLIENKISPEKIYLKLKNNKKSVPKLMLDFLNYEN